MCGTGCRLTVAALGACVFMYAFWRVRRFSTGSPFALSTKFKRRWLRLHRHKAFVLMVTLTFQEASHKEAFVGIWTVLAQHVQAHEPGALAFELLQSDASPQEVLVYERYIEKDYYLSVHRTSAPMAKFKQSMAEADWKAEVKGHSYDELDIGFQ